jgi:cell division septation protein DedD
MSAWKLGRASDAATYAQQASKSSDASTRGRALVVLADTQLALKEYATAAESFEQAAAAFASAQAPSDANAARGFAQRARDAIPTRVVVAAPAPEPVTAPKRPATAQTGSTVEPRPTAASARTATPTKREPPRQFTIRAGSYSTLKAAEKRVRAISKDLARANAPDARIEEVTTVSGERLYAVRIGAWPTRADAEKVMGKISRKDLMVGGFESSD